MNLYSVPIAIRSNRELKSYTTTQSFQMSLTLAGTYRQIPGLPDEMLPSLNTKPEPRVFVGSIEAFVVYHLLGIHPAEQ